MRIRKVPMKKQDEKSLGSTRSSAQILQKQIQREKSKRKRLEDDVQSLRSELLSQVGALSQLQRA